MPIKRPASQKQIITLMDENFLRRIESGMMTAGYSDRSKFIRDAVFEKLRRLDVACNYKLAMAPSRTGKGGSKTSTRSIRTSESSTAANFHLNETPPGYTGKKPGRKRHPGVREKS